MANKMDADEFKFPDEVDEPKGESEDFEFEIEDDTPPEDRDKKPMLGVAGFMSIVVQYQKELFEIGLSFNFFGIVYIAQQIS